MADRTKPLPAEITRLKKRIRSVDKVKPYVKVLPYGPNGSGKTTLAGTAENCLIIDVNEDGTRSIAGKHTGAKVFEANSWHDIGTMYWMLKEGGHGYEAVSIDTITAMNHMAMSFVLGEAEERDPTRERSMPDKRSYGRAGELVKGMLLAYRNLPMHVIFCAQERTIRDEDTEEIVDITVDLPAGSRSVALGCVSILGHMEPREVPVKVRGKRTKKWKYLMRVGPNEVVRTKDRTRILGDYVVNPTMPQLIEAWLNRKEEE